MKSWTSTGHHSNSTGSSQPVSPRSLVWKAAQEILGSLTKHTPPHLNLSLARRPPLPNVPLLGPRRTTWEQWGTIHGNFQRVPVPDPCGGGAQGACEAQSAPVIQEIQILCQSTK